MEFDWHTLITLVLGGTSIVELVYIGSEKRRRDAEASSAHYQAKQKRLVFTQDAYNYLLEKLNTFQAEYFELSERVQKQTQKHLEEINEKCDEIAALKSKIIYFKGLRCYRSDCSRRIEHNPKDAEHDHHEEEVINENQGCE